MNCAVSIQHAAIMTRLRAAIAQLDKSNPDPGETATCIGAAQYEIAAALALLGDNSALDTLIGRLSRYEIEERYDCPIHGTGDGPYCPRC